MNIYIVNAVLLTLSAVIYRDRYITIIGLSKEKTINTYRSFFLLFWFLILSLEYGLRGNFTTDYIQYRNWFVSAQSMNFADIIYSSNIEKGFLFLNYLVSHITSEYYIMTIVYGVLSVGFYIVAIKNSIDVVWAPIIVFVGIGIFYGGFNLSTQMLAASIFAISVKYIYEKKPVKYCLLILLAISFHKSAIFMLPIYLISKIKLNRRNKHIVIALVIGTGIVFSIFVKRVALVLSTYVYGDTYLTYQPALVGQGWGYILKHIAITAIIMYYGYLFDTDSPKEKLLYLGSILNCIIAIWSGQVALIQRFSYYFIIFPMLAMGHIVKEDKIDRHLLKLLLVFFFFIMQIGWFGNEYFTFMYNK